MKIKQLRQAKGVTQQQLADAIGISRVAVSKWESGETKDLKRENLIGIARFFNMTIAEVLDVVEPSMAGLSDILDEPARISSQTVKWVDSIGEPIKEWNDEADLNPDEFVIIPRYAITVSAGNGHVVHEELQLHQGQAYRVDWLKAMGLKGHDLKSIKATGDSMLPTFGDGCTLLVDFSHKQISEGKVYVIRFGDEIRVKRIHKRADGGIIIRSDNRDAYPDINIPPDEMGNIEILGRVRHYSGEL